MNKLIKKLFLAFLITITLLTTVIIILTYSILRTNYQDTLISDLNNINFSISNQITDYFIAGKVNELDSLIKKIGKSIHIRITIIDIKGTVLADSRKNPQNMENHSDRPEIIKAIKMGEGSSIRHSYTINQDLLYVANPIKHGNEILCISRLSVNINDIDLVLANLKNKIIGVSSIVAIIAFVFAFFVSRRISKPIKELIEVTESVSNGNFNVKANVYKKDELGMLGNSINNMTDRIKELFNSIEKKKEELDNIISSLQEGLLVIERSGKIIFGNISFKKIFKNDNIDGKFFWEIIRDNKVNKIVKKVQTGNSFQSEQIQVEDNYYICNVYYINKLDEIVLIFNNITDIKNVENLKKEFVSNVSHELKTPLTVIKGYIEVLEELSPATKYIEIIKKHTNRLIYITNDLLAISNLEDKNTVLNIELVNLPQLIHDIHSSFERKLIEKKLEFTINSAGSQSIEGDAYRLEQLFINLIDNAIKYTNEGSVTINLSSNENYAQVEVIDTGVGISPKDIKRVFERFYTVDKSRSRQLDGTGLGLSIVKHIVNLHKGKITVESEISKGTKFTVLLPYHN